MRVVPVNGSFTVDGNNVITATHDPFSFVPTKSVQFEFLTAPNITWWKAIKIFNAKNQMISLMANQDQDHGPESSLPLPLSQFGDQVKVEIWKAKALGAHTHVDTVAFKVSECSGKLIRLFWEND